MNTRCKLAAGICAASWLVIAAPLGRSAESVTLFRNGDGYKAFRIPAIIRAANGDLLAFCEARQGGDASEIDLVMKRSNDAGRTWSKLQIVQDSQDYRDLVDDPEVPITVGNPAPVVDVLDPDYPGRIWLPFTLENDRVFVIHSDDHGRTWSERREITSTVKKDSWGWYATGPVHGIQLLHGPGRGRLVIPADHRLGIGGSDSGSCGAQLMVSDDHGKTWRLGAIDASYEDGLEANETTIVELKDGRLYVNTRDQNGPAPGTRGAAYSSDAGNSFEPTGNSQYSPFVPLSAPFDPPVVQCSLLRARSTTLGDDSDLILFSGPDESGPHGPGRSDLRIRYTTDETRTWHDGLLVHAGPAAYSDMVLLPPDHVGVLFEAGDPAGRKYDRIDFKVIPIQEILQARGASD